MNTKQYTRTWREIEWMLAESKEQMFEHKWKFEQRKKARDKDGCKRAAAKFARAKGMVDVLTWVIGGEDTLDPLLSFEDISDSPSLERYASLLQSRNI